LFFKLHRQCQRLAARTGTKIHDAPPRRHVYQTGQQLAALVLHLEGAFLEAGRREQRGAILAPQPIGRKRRRIECNSGPRQTRAQRFPIGAQRIHAQVERRLGGERLRQRLGFLAPIPHQRVGERLGQTVTYCKRERGGINGQQRIGKPPRLIGRQKSGQRAL